VYPDAGDLAMFVYSLIPILFMSAFHGMPILIDDRGYLLEIIYYYLTMYERLKTHALNP
jgi:hypothetical protein